MIPALVLCAFIPGVIWTSCGISPARQLIEAGRFLEAVSVIVREWLALLPVMLKAYCRIEYEKAVQVFAPRSYDANSETADQARSKGLVGGLFPEEA